jgi:hypothetical protein
LDREQIAKLLEVGIPPGVEVNRKTSESPHLHALPFPKLTLLRHVNHHTLMSNLHSSKWGHSFFANKRKNALFA